MKGKIRLLAFVVITGCFLLAAAGSQDESKTAAPLYADRYAIEATFETLIKKNLRDPDSYQFVKCDSLGFFYGYDHCFLIEYRAKNGFGGYSIGNAVVSCDSTTMRMVRNECE